MSVLLSRARHDQCRWLVSSPVEPASVKGDAFGRARVCGGAASYPTGYCAAHRRLAYEPAPAVRAYGDSITRRAEPEPDLQPELTEIFG